MKNIRFLSENVQFLVMKFSIYLNRRVFVMDIIQLFIGPLHVLITLAMVSNISTTYI